MVIIKGFVKFREKLPILSGKRIAVIPLYIIFISIITFLIYTIFDTLPELLMTSGTSMILLSFFPLFGVLLLEITGLFLVWQMWLWRNSLKERYGPTSYQRIVFSGFAGIIMVISIAFNQYIPYYSYAPTFWASSPLQSLATSLEGFFGGVGSVIFYVTEILAVILLIIGLMMCARAIQVFGVDYMAVVYLYFPEESRIQENEIYSVLRHPAYASMLIIALGGTFHTFTILSFLSFLTFLLGFYVHIYLVEEKELIQRFGDSYKSYQKKVPAFFIKPKDINIFLRFLLMRDR
ncbi:MAG: hypothetical protein HPY60_08990 [Candidatus Methanofastidiosum sp.]|nr:hypothetical protein [Methanofastidiosum sp.]